MLDPRLVSETAHRLRSPLTVVRAHAELLAHDVEDAASHESACAIRAAAQQLQAVCDELVDQLRDAPADLETAVRRFLELQDGGR